MKKKGRLILFSEGAGLLCLMILFLLLGRRANVAQDSASIGIIGGADGPTAIFLAGNEQDGETKIISEDGLAELCIYTEKDEVSKAQVIQEIVISKAGEKQSYTDVTGYFEEAKWLEGDSLVLISYYGRQWKDFILIDVENKKVIYQEAMSIENMLRTFKAQGESIDYQIDERADAKFFYKGISDDHQVITIQYNAYDTNGNIQSGEFEYNVETKKVSGLIQDQAISEG